MRCPFAWGLVVLCVSLSVPASSAAQFSITLGGGMTIPGGGFADGISSTTVSEVRAPARNGWSLSLDAGYTLGATGVTVGARGLMGLTDHVDVEPGTTLQGTLLFGEYALTWLPTVEPFLYGAVGHLSYSYRTRQYPRSSTKDAGGRGVQVGGGVGLPLGTLTLRLDGSWTSGAGEVDDIEFLRFGATMRMRFGS